MIFSSNTERLNDINYNLYMHNSNRACCSLRFLTADVPCSGFFAHIVQNTFATDLLLFLQVYQLLETIDNFLHHLNFSKIIKVLHNEVLNIEKAWCFIPMWPIYLSEIPYFSYGIAHHCSLPPVFLKPTNPCANPTNFGLYKLLTTWQVIECMVYKEFFRN